MLKLATTTAADARQALAEIRPAVDLALAALGEPAETVSYPCQCDVNAEPVETTQNIDPPRTLAGDGGRRGSISGLNSRGSRL